MGQVINTKAMHDKRGLESVIHTLQAEIDDALQQAKNSEEKSKRAMVDAARLADELRAEQDHVQAESRAKRALDTQLGELEVRLSDAEATAVKGGKNAMAKLEMRIRELEMELGSVQSRTGESYKAFQRAERRVKSYNSNKRRIVRIKIVWETWPTSSNKRSRLTSNKLRKQKKLLPSTWLNIARLNKSLRKLRNVPRWQDSKWKISDLCKTPLPNLVMCSRAATIKLF